MQVKSRANQVEQIPDYQKGLHRLKMKMERKSLIYINLV